MGGSACLHSWVLGRFGNQVGCAGDVLELMHVTMPMSSRSLVAVKAHVVSRATEEFKACHVCKSYHWYWGAESKQGLRSDHTRPSVLA